MNNIVMRVLRTVAKSCAELTNPKPRPARVQFRPSLEGLEQRWCPAIVNMYWDPTVIGYYASNASNWDTGSLGSGTHPTNAPGNTSGETDNIYLDGTAGKNGNKNCVWDYTPSNNISYLYFQNAYTQTLTFSDKEGFSVATYATVTGSSGPTITPNGSSGSSAVAAITMKSGAVFNVDSGSTLYLQGYSSGNAIFIAGDGTAGEYLANGGTVSYSGVGNSSRGITDYLKIPVLNGWTSVFKVNGNYGSSNYGSALQVSGADTTYTGGVSFYQNSSGAETDISGRGTLWCVNDFKMTAGALKTTDTQTDTLQVGTGGTSPVDGTVFLTGGSVNIDPGTHTYGTLAIVGTTGANVPTLDVGTVTLNFKVNMTAGSPQCDKLIVGDNNGTGKVNFGYNGGTTTVAISPQGFMTTGHNWQVMFFGSRNGDVTLDPTSGYSKKWNSNNLEIDN